MPASEAKTSRIETLIRQLQGRTARDILYGSGLSAASFGGGVALTAAIPHGLQDDDGNPVAPSWAEVQSSEIVSTVGTGPVIVSFQATPWDATNLYVRARIADGGTSLNFPTWYWTVVS
jgi:hypothetical protein